MPTDRLWFDFIELVSLSPARTTDPSKMDRAAGFLFWMVDVVKQSADWVPHARERRRVIGLCFVVRARDDVGEAFPS